jgi:hypothetical protein
MKTLRVCVVVSGLLLWAGASASAQERGLIGIVTKRQNSLSKVLKVKGCSDWLSQVVADSKIDPDNLQQVPVGRRLYLVNGSCRETAPADIAARSKIILSVDKTPAQVAQARRETQVFRTRNEALVQNTKKLETEIAELKGRLKEAQASLLKATSVQTPPVAPSKFKVTRNMAAIGLVAIVGTALLVFFWLQNWKKKRVVLLKQWTINEDGKDTTFVLVGAGPEVTGAVVGRYKCPICGENNLFGREGNLRRHLTQSHPHVSVTVDPTLNQQP